MFENRALTEGRIRRFHRDHLVRAIHQETAPVTVTAYRVPGEPIPPREAIAQEYEPFEIGSPLAKAWGTIWLHVTGSVPQRWAEAKDCDAELIVDLEFGQSPGFQAEALVFTPDAVPVKAINPFNRYLTVTPGEDIDVYLECAANPEVSGGWDFAPTVLGDPDTLPEEEIWSVRELRLARRNQQIWELAEDFRALGGLMRALPESSNRRHEILRALERACDVADPDDMPGTVGAAREVLRPALEAKAGSSALTMIATGHAHIDSAWLWPVRETRRKCARTFSNVVTLMDADPDLTFACSSAQQYRWIKDDYPELFERIREKVAEGRWTPVGGMWVESDTNMPGSEAMARQFVAGKRFFLEEFGVDTTETWLPDSFGYSAALPQITALAGHRNFLTQKVSWNQFNTFPHHSFRWEGLDGTSVFTHFPPADTYNGMLSGEELGYIESNFKEKGRAGLGLDIFGWGDGGGGPTREMMAAGRRAADLEGSPKVEFSTAPDFFERAEAEYPDAPVWAGELYLELHRGTLSAQLPTKQGNRRSEHLLHEVEAIAALAALRTDFPYPYDEIQSLWEDVLLAQFHDILPGSSIAWVHRDAERNYAAVARRGEEIVAAALAALGGTGADDADTGEVLLNTAPVPRRGVAAYGAGAPADDGPEVNVSRADGEVTIANGLVQARIDASGALASLTDGNGGREAIAPDAPAALLQLHRDTPNQWDAWDIDEFYRHVVRDLDRPVSSEVTEDADGVRVAYTYSTAVGDGEDSHGVTGAGSTITKTYVLRPGDTALEIVLDLDWREHKKALKLAFPLDVRANVMSSEIQFGHLDRPIPVNTSWDFARFETCAHRWVHLAEGGYGVAIANDSTYGHDVLRTVRAEDGGTTTTPRLTIVRSPEFPDPGADHGSYTARVAIRPGARKRDAIAEGYRLNLPERRIPGLAATAAEETGTGAGTLAPLVASDNPAVVVETVKLAEDRSGDLVVRLYEAEGSRAHATLTLAEGLGGAAVVDLLERPFGEDTPAFRTSIEQHGDAVELDFRPFQITTLRIPRA